MNYSLSQETIEEYIRLLDNLLSQDKKREIKTLMASSSVTGEGSSRIISDFAKVLAENCGHRVLLVDGNIRAPSLHNILNVRKENGLSEFLSGGLNLEGALKNSGISGLSVITCGRNNGMIQGRLSENNKFKNLIKTAGDRFDYVLFDSAPVNLSTDSRILSSVVDGVILVIHAEKTRREVVSKTRETLEQAGADVLGAVLNRRKYYIPNFIYKRL